MTISAKAPRRLQSLVTALPSNGQQHSGHQHSFWLGLRSAPHAIEGLTWREVGAPLRAQTQTHNTTPQQQQQQQQQQQHGLTGQNHSTVTLLARLRGLSTSQPRATAM